MTTALASCESSIRHDAVRTILVCWTAGARLHRTGNELLTCRFGCPAEADALQHYVRCPILMDTYDMLLPMVTIGPLPCLRRMRMLPVSAQRAALGSIP